MKRINGLFILIVILLMASCEDLFNTDEGGLTTEEVIEGLKTALVVGTDSSVAVTSALDGYYRDPIIKILMPEEADVILNNLDNQVFHTLGLTTLIDQQVEKVILSVNRAAEDAASGAAPIFKQSISDLSITDAWSILKGKNPAANTKSSGDFDSTAATAYLKSTTYDSLINFGL